MADARLGDDALSRPAAALDAGFGSSARLHRVFREQAGFPAASDGDPVPEVFDPARIDSRFVIRDVDGAQRH